MPDIRNKKNISLILEKDGHLFICYCMDVHVSNEQPTRVKGFSHLLMLAFKINLYLLIVLSFYFYDTCTSHQAVCYIQ